MKDNAQNYGSRNIARNKLQKSRKPCLALFFVLGMPFFSHNLLAQKPEAKHNCKQQCFSENLGNYYYNLGEYELARIEFEREYRRRTRQKRPLFPLPQKIALSLMRRHEFRKTLPYLLPQKDFGSRYLSMYAALRQGRVSMAQQENQRIQKTPDLGKHQKELARLLSGSILLEFGENQKAKELYETLHFQAQNPDVRKAAGQVVKALENYEGLETKSAVLAGVFSAVLPGAGQVYTGFYVDAGVALFFNTMFLGSAAVLYDLETQADRPHQMSLLAGLIGLGFYIANITGAVSSAHRYNHYYKRKFHEDIRRHFFNLDFIERTSGIRFTERF